MPPPDPDDKSADEAVSEEPPPAHDAPTARPGPSPLRETARRYQARGPLGKGSMGEVVLCRDARIGREVALKRLAAKRVGDEGARARFLREAQVQGQLEHPAVLPVYDLDADESGADFFTMKRLRGQTLAEIVDGLRRGDEETVARFPLRRLLGALSAACLAVDFAHSRGVIHRDIKPSNVMLGEYGEVYVLDWGIAKLSAVGPGDALALPEDATRDTARTQSGKILGTWGYMAPEQARGRVERIDARSDVYSLGAVLFEMLALEPLHKKDMWSAMLMETVQGVSAVASERAPGRDVPPELDAICVKATALEPSERYQTARELHDALERYLQGDRDLEMRRELAASHARAAELAMRRSLSGSEGGGARGDVAEEGVRTALAEAGRALALEPTNADALRVVAAVLSATPREIPAEVKDEVDAHARARHRKQLREAVGADMAGLFLMTPFVLWMGVRSYPTLAAAVVLTVASTAIKIVAVQRARNRTLYPAAFAAFVFNVLALMCIGMGFGPLLFMPTLLTAFTFGYCMSYRKRYRLAVIATGVIAILLLFGAEQVGVLPPSYAFHDGAMTILPRAVTLTPFATTVALLVGSVFMVIAPGILMGRLQGILRQAEERAFLQTWRLKNLLPDDAAGYGTGPDSTGHMPESEPVRKK